MESRGAESTTQRMTAPLRSGMRAARRQKAEALLRQGVTKAEVARSVGLSPSRISAMKTLSSNNGIDTDCWDEDTAQHVLSVPT